MRKLRPWILAFRPKTLTAALVPVFVGTILARQETGQVDWGLSALILGAALCIQIATNLFNDAIDHKKGADTEERLGPRRATQMGWLTSRQVHAMAFVFLGLALLCGVPLVLKGGITIVLIGLVSLLLAYAYTGGPVPLAYFGLGDLFVILFFGGIAVGGTYFLQSLTYSTGALVAGIQVGALGTVLIAINNLRDADQDRKVGKRTLAVLMGPQFVRYEILFLFLLSFGLGAYWWQKGFLGAAVLPLVGLPLATRVTKGIFFHPPGALYNKFLAMAALEQILFGGFFSLGLMWGWA